MGKYRHVDIDFKFSKELRQSAESFEHVQALTHKKKKAPKLLIILDHVPKEDLQRGMLLGGYTGEALTALENLATGMYGASRKLNDHDFVIVNYNCFKTYGKDKQFQDAADVEFTKRINSLIVSYKPDTVLTMGYAPMMALNSAYIHSIKGAYHNIFGVPISTKVKHNGKKHKFKHVSNLSLSGILGETGGDLGTNSYMAGYFARNLVGAFEGKLRYQIPDLYELDKKGKRKPKYKTILCDTIKLVKKCLNKMAFAPVVAVDTETNNLYKISNKVLTIQFAKDTKTAYIIPLHHKDSPFTPKEKNKIIKMIVDYFEYKNENKYQVYANAQFDLNVMRCQFGIRYFKADLWDLFAGEFVFDENMKLLSTVSGKYFYSLGNLTMQYGCTAYYDAAFGKENRKVIKDVDLDEDLQEYCALDVIVPMHIYALQRQRAQDLGYTYYDHMVGHQISDQLHTFSTLEATGVLTDLEYLFNLKLPDSPINQSIKDTEKKLASLPVIDEVNAILGKEANIPTEGLFGTVKPDLFNIKKNEHKQILFIDVLGLKPIKFGKKTRANGKKEAKIDKAFQEKYGKDENIIAVKLFTQLTKSKKLHDAFVKSFIKLWQKDEDFQTDKRIRPRYHFLKVVTGRTSASDPNLQQIPSRSELGKHIKRLFIAADGKIMIKVDYSAHEVRCWSIISGDKSVAASFQVGTDFRDRFKVLPDPWIGKRIELEGDVHKVNASYFFGIDITAVDKTIRNAIKGVIFGLIYQQSMKNLAMSIGRPLKVVQDIVAQFLARYPVGVNWFDKIKAQASKFFYIESPLGRRRHLWGLCLPKSIPDYEQMEARCLRQCVNSPVQGFGSDFMMQGIRNVDRMKYEHFQETGHYPDMDLCVSVHDSLTVEVGYADFWLALNFIDRGLTSEVVKNIDTRWGKKMISNPEVDFEIGPTERDVKGWDFDYHSMKKHIERTLDLQIEELGYEIDKKKVMKTIFSDQYDTMPDWMKKQLHSIDPDTHTEKLGEDIRTKKERKTIKGWLKEMPANLRKLKEMQAIEDLRTKAIAKKAAKKLERMKRLGVKEEKSNSRFDNIKD